MVHDSVPGGMAQSQAGGAVESTNRTPQAASFAFLKGGTSKTTLSVNTARHLAERNGEGSTLLIDFDPNGHATQNYDYGHDGLYESGTDLDKVILGTEAEMHPSEVTVETDLKFDLLPATEDHENLKKSLSDVIGGSNRLRKRVVEELLGDEYEYIIIDQPSNPGMMNNNGVYASRNLILPMLPKGETNKSYKRTKDRLITPLKDLDHEVNILAVVPNLLGSRIDQQTTDRQMLEMLNTSPMFEHLVPDFARITEEEWGKIDSGEMKPPKPGIRETAAITNGMQYEGLPLLDYEPSNSQNKHFAELAAIIEQGGVSR